MKALSLLPEWAMPVALGFKTVEMRTWKTEYRGELLICASSKKFDGYIHGHAIAVVDLVDIEPFGKEHLDDALLYEEDIPDKKVYAWLLSNADMVEPFPVKGREHLFDVEDSQIKVLGEPSRELVERYYMPLIYRGRNSKCDQLWEDVYQIFGW